jgi:hypothetical protein
MVRRTIRCLAAAAALGAILTAGCSDPLGGEDKPTHVVTLALPAVLQPGRYLIYWNGKDKNGAAVAPGAYRCVLDAGVTVQEIQMTALAGTKGKSADSTGTGTGIWYFAAPVTAWILDQNFPEPFYAADGTNIPFEIPEPSTVVLAIHRKN